MSKIILILSLLFLAGCGQWEVSGSNACYWEQTRHRDEQLCFQGGQWVTRQVVHKYKDHRHYKHKRHHRRHRHHRHRRH